MAEDEDYSDRTKNPFWNASDDILKLITGTIARFGIVSCDYEMSDVLKQQMKIELVKTLFSLSTILNPNLMKELKDEVLKLEVGKVSMVVSGNQKIKYVYDKELDKRLWEIVMQINSKIQEKGYFMPSKEEDEDDY